MAQIAPPVGTVFSPGVGGNQNIPVRPPGTADRVPWTDLSTREKRDIEDIGNDDDDIDFPANIAIDPILGGDVTVPAEIDNFLPNTMPEFKLRARRAADATENALSRNTKEGFVAALAAIYYALALEGAVYRDVERLPPILPPPKSKSTGTDKRVAVPVRKEVVNSVYTIVRLIVQRLMVYYEQTRTELFRFELPSSSSSPNEQGASQQAAAPPGVTEDRVRELLDNLESEQLELRSRAITDQVLRRLADDPAASSALTSMLNTRLTEFEAAQKRVLDAAAQELEALKTRVERPVEQLIAVVSAQDVAVATATREVRAEKADRLSDMQSLESRLAPAQKTLADKVAVIETVDASQSQLIDQQAQRIRNLEERLRQLIVSTPPPAPPVPMAVDNSQGVEIELEGVRRDAQDAVTRVQESLDQQKAILEQTRYAAFERQDLRRDLDLRAENIIGEVQKLVRDDRRMAESKRRAGRDEPNVSVFAVLARNTVLVEKILRLRTDFIDAIDTSDKNAQQNRINEYKRNPVFADRAGDLVTTYTAYVEFEFRMTAALFTDSDDDDSDYNIIAESMWSTRNADGRGIIERFREENNLSFDQFREAADDNEKMLMTAYNNYVQQNHPEAVPRSR